MRTRTKLFIKLLFYATTTTYAHFANTSVFSVEDCDFNISKIKHEHDTTVQTIANERTIATIAMIESNCTVLLKNSEENYSSTDGEILNVGYAK